mmetsp:Transcript_6037/g.14620  ORF Transcript_6037/g.14620 Transcript_6037/m.14620 type:complete len:239 (+) Transcript_6037:275-991(+)
MGRRVLSGQHSGPAAVGADGVAELLNPGLHKREGTFPRAIPAAVEDHVAAVGATQDRLLGRSDALILSQRVADGLHLLQEPRLGRGEGRQDSALRLELRADRLRHRLAIRLALADAVAKAKGKARVRVAAGLLDRWKRVCGRAVGRRLVRGHVRRAEGRVRLRLPEPFLHLGVETHAEVQVAARGQEPTDPGLEADLKRRAHAVARAALPARFDRGGGALQDRLCPCAPAVLDDLVRG